MKVQVTLKVSEAKSGKNEDTTFAFPEFPEGHEFDCAEIIVAKLHEAANEIGGIAAKLELVGVTTYNEDGTTTTLDADAARKAAKAAFEGVVIENLLKKGVPPEALGLPPTGSKLDS